MALLATMLVLFGVLAIILVGMVGNSKTNSGSATSTLSGLRLANMGLQADEALNISEAGVDYTRLWLVNQSGPPANTSAFAPSLWGCTQAGTTPPRSTINYPNSASNFSYFSVTIYPNAGNSGNTLKRYLIESIGVYGSEKVILHVYVQESSFAKYALFIDNSTGGYWSSNNRYFDGPVHINGGSNTGVIWRDNTQALFDYTGPDAFTVGFSSMNFAHNIASNGPNTPPITTADWATVCSGGAPSVKWGQPTIAMPTSSYMQEYAALGQTIPNPATTAPTGAPTAYGVTVEPNGGLFINGDVRQMTLSVSNSVNQVITINQKDSSNNVYVSVVTLNAQTNQTTLTVTKTPPTGLPVITTTTTSGTTNGVVYCTGNIGGSGIGGICGTIADNNLDSFGNVTHYSALTIATDYSKNANIDGSITVNTPRQQSKNSSGQLLYRDSDGNTTTSSTNAMPIYVKETADTGNFLSHAGTLGIVSNTVEVLDHTYDSTGTTQVAQLNNMEVDAAVLTNNTYEVYNASTRPKGTFLNMGCYLITNGARINNTDSTGAIINGPYLSRTYDARLANTPPPYFPTTGINYDVLSWQRVGATIQ